MKVASVDAVRTVNISDRHTQSETVMFVHNKQLVTIEELWVVEGEFAAIAPIKDKDVAFHTMNASVATLVFLK